MEEKPQHTNRIDQWNMKSQILYTVGTEMRVKIQEHGLKSDGRNKNKTDEQM